MSTHARTFRSRWLVGAAAAVAAVVTLLLVYTPADRLFTRTFQQGPLAIFAGVTVAVLASRWLAGPRCPAAAESND